LELLKIQDARRPSKNRDIPVTVLSITGKFGTMTYFDISPPYQPLFCKTEQAVTVLVT